MESDLPEPESPDVGAKQMALPSSPMVASDRELSLRLLHPEIQPPKSKTLQEVLQSMESARPELVRHTS